MKVRPLSEKGRGQERHLVNLIIKLGNCLIFIKSLLWFMSGIRISNILPAKAGSFLNGLPKKKS